MVGHRSVRRSARLSALFVWLFARIAGAATVYGLAGNGAFLVRFESQTPSTIDGAAFVSGLALGERIVAIDFRPRTGQLYGVAATAGGMDLLRLFTIDPHSGVATLVPGSSSIPVTFATAYGASFNPTVDRLRVVNGADENLRLNPNNGARADSPTNDTDLNPPTSSITGIAYDRPFDSGFAAANRTTLFGLATATDSRVTIGGIDQSPSPNLGIVQNSQALGETPTGDAGYDIDVDGDHYAAFSTGAGTGFWFLDTATGDALLLGGIGSTAGSLPVTGIAVVPRTVVATGADAGSAPRVRVIDGASGTERFVIDAYDAKQKRGVRVAVGDVDLDGEPELITAPGKGAAPEIRLFHGLLGTPLASFPAFDERFRGGVNVAAGDVDGDGHKDVIAAMGSGGPDVRVFSGLDQTLILELAAYDPTFKGGVSVASADLDNDGDWEIVTGPGKGGVPLVRIFDATGAPFVSPLGLPNSILAYGEKQRKGVTVAAGDVNGDGVADIVVGPGKGAPPEVAAFSGVDGSELGRFLAFDAKQRGGVRVAVGDVDADGRYEILAAPGKGAKGGSGVRAFDGRTFAEKTSFLAFDADYRRGVFVSGVRR
jgi:hypothetical protein